MTILRPILSGIFGTGQATKLPYGSRIAFWGDSLTAQAFTGTRNGGTESWISRGAVAWAQILSQHRCYAGRYSNHGVSGETSTQILARASALNAVVKPAIVVINAGTNDLGGISSATTISNLTSMINACRSFGARIILTKIYPRAATGTTPMSGSQLTSWVAVNAWIETQATANDIIVVDAEPLLGTLDNTHMMKTSVAANATTDLLHLNQTGAYLAGGVTAAAIRSWVSSGEYRATTELGSGNILTNGIFTGTAGTLLNGALGTNPADGWTVNAISTVSGGATLTAAKVTRDDAVGETQQITASGTYTGTARILRANRSLSSSTPLAGEYWQVYCNVKLNSGATSNILGFTPQVQTPGIIAISPGTLLDPWPTNEEVQLRSLPYLLASNFTSSNIWAQAALLDTGTTDAVSGVVQFGRMGFYKVTV